MIKFENVKKSINGIDIIDNVSFSIENNTITSFVGSKNAGKSTLLRLIAGVYKTYFGKINVDGKCALFFDKNEVDTHLTVSEYLGFYANICGLDQKDVDTKIDYYLSKYSLLSYKRSDLSHLDAATLKLIGIIRVLIGNPDIMVFDKLLTDDVELNDRLFDIINEYKGRKTMIFASTKFDKLSEISDNLGILSHGKLIAFGDRDKVFSMADKNKKYIVDIASDEEKAISILNTINGISDLVYSNNTISFSLTSNMDYNETKIMKKLIDEGVSILSFRKEQMTFEKVFNKINEK